MLFRPSNVHRERLDISLQFDKMHMELVTLAEKGGY